MGGPAHIDLSHLNLPALPVNFTSVAVYSEETANVDGTTYLFAAVTVHATDAEPDEVMFASNDRIHFESVDAIRAAAAAHYSIGLDRVQHVEVEGLPQ